MEETRKDEIELSLRKKYHKTIFSRFARAINHYQLVENGDHVAVCMEQGRNELILAKCFQEIKRHRKIDFEVDFFGLCREDDGKIVSIAEETGIPVRKIRSYGEIKEAGCNKVAVADCYEDVIETILAGVLYKGEISTLMPKEKGCGERLELIRPFYTCYSWVAYQTAYLKANYPPEYMAAVMSRSLSNITDITKLMDECKAMGIQTLGPDVNESNLKFTVNHDGDIRFGLGAVKGVGEAAVQSIMEERRKNGPFLGIFDFVQRVNLNACNKKNMECLALAGGFDSFPELKREQYFAVNSKGEVFLETLMRYGNRYQADKAAAVNSLFGGENVIDVATPEIPQGVERWSDLDRLNRERDLVGIYLSAHPLDEFSIVLEHVCNTRMADLEDKAALVGREITMGGIVTSVRRGVSKNGNPYGIAKIEDYSGSTEIPFWGNDWVTYQGYLNEGTFLYIKARCQAKQWRQDELEVKITSMELLPDVKEELVQKITIVIPLSVLNSALVTELATLTKEHPGNTELYFKVTDDADVTHMSVDLISRPVRLSVGRDLITYLKERPELGFHIN